MALLTSSLSTDVLILLVTAALLLYKLSRRNFTYWKDRNVPYTEPVPFAGNFLPVFSLQVQIGLYLQGLYRKFIKHRYFGLYVFNQPFLVINDLELIQNVTVKDFHNFSDHIILSDDAVDSVAGKMLFFIKNPLWRKTRVKLSPVFSSGKLKGMMHLINEVADSLLVHLEKLSSQSDSIEARESLAKYGTDVISSCAFGIRANCFENEDAEFRVASRKLFACDWKTGVRQTSHFFVHSLAKALNLPFFPRETTAFLRDAFWSAIKDREDSKTKRGDLIDIVIQIKNGEADDDEVKFDGDLAVAQAAQFFAAGFETTSSTLSFTLYELCLNQEIQDRVRAEIAEAIPTPESFTYENILGMKYTHMVVSETLRKYPVLPFLDRQCLNDYAVPDSDLIIEKGTPVLIPLAGIHYDERYYPDPQKYDPERFSDENKDKIPQFAYMPFGAGPRVCIGERFGLLSVKVGLIRVLSQFKVLKNDKTPDPLVIDPKGFLFNSIVGFPMTFKKLDTQ